jgi:hypothetical protein
MPTPVTTTELADLIRPFVGKRLRGDVSASLEIDAPGQRYGNADVRSFDGDLVEVFFFSSTEFIPLAAIRRIVVRSVEDGNFTSEATYEHVRQRARVSA